MFAWSGGFLTTLVLGTAGAGLWVYRHLDGNITSADLDQHLGGNRPQKLASRSMNILVVGSDSRAGANAKYGKGMRTMQSDTLMVVHLSADRKWATVMSLPRDSYVRIPSCDRGDGTTSAPHSFKINESFAIGGSKGDISRAAACTIKTVEANTGLRMDHFMSLDFQGFKGMVNALGGVEVCPKEPIHDAKAHLDMEPGCQTVRDEKALGYVRSRYSMGDGSDLGRIGRQQEFMRALAEKARKKVTSPDELYGFLDETTKSLTTDKDLAGLKPLYNLANEVKGIPKDRLTFLTVPNYPRQADVPSDKANVVWQYPQAAGLFDKLAHDKEVDKEQLEASSKDPVPTRSVRVRVLDGTGTGGRAAEAAEDLRELGFTVASTGDAPEPVRRTTVGYPDALRRSAEVLAARLPYAAERGGEQAGAGTVTLTVGPDYKSPR
ncbi:LCP family protein [Streptomyces albiaxialis]|uniref:LCP family protein n=1 Tax=Streptomyces albiaxialis TaxID=329523 RepID=UPI0031E02E22